MKRLETRRIMMMMSIGAYTQLYGRRRRDDRLIFVGPEQNNVEGEE